MKLIAAILFFASIGSGVWAAERALALMNQAVQSFQDSADLISK